MVTVAYKKAVQRLWDGRAVIVVRNGVLNPATGRTEPVEQILAENVPCRISYKIVEAAVSEEDAARLLQTVTLFIDSALDIPPGAKITVTQKGVSRDYERSGKAAVYSVHQEIPLKLWKEWA